MDVKGLGEERAAALDLVGGELCLDFSNTVGGRGTAKPQEHLRNYTALTAWGEHVGILPPRAARMLRYQAAHRPRQAQAVLDRALELREAIYRVFSAFPQGRPPSAGDVAILNRVLAEAMPHVRLVASDGSFRWDWAASRDSLDQMLWPIARSAALLLTSNRVERVRECDGQTCGWLFVDTSKNHSRRWCSMGDCGNRAKAQRFYAKRRLGAGKTVRESRESRE